MADMTAQMVVRVGHLAEVERLYGRIPEFTVGDVPAFERRLAGDDALLLVADADGDLVGFKVGYDRFKDGSFYSWLGGVVPAHRQRGVAVMLLRAQEAEVRALGYTRIYCKTRNRFIGMRVLLAKEGYQVVAVDAEPGLVEARLTHVKTL